MRGLTRRWILPDHADSRGNGLPAGVGPGRTPLLERLLSSRGLNDGAAVEAFCDPRLTGLHDPGLFPDIDRAVARLIDALRRRQRIVIYGDYDVDGVTATAILYHTLKLADPSGHVTWYVPHRLEEGYGVNIEALRSLAAAGAEMVVTVDCGITAVEAAIEAQRLGLDLIITDHHVPKAEILPAAFAIVHPGLSIAGAAPYPFRDLCGAGVAFKLAWRFATTWCGSARVSESYQKLLLDLLPLAALGTIADVAPLTGENRIIAAFGLRQIRNTRFAGLNALIEASGLGGEKINAESVGFVLAPRLNACGRMGHAADAVRMLTDAGPDEAVDIAQRLASLNRERQRTERSIFDHARRLADDTGQTRDDHRVIVLADPAWHPGVVGIVCSRMVEAFGRPTILMQRQGDACKGSARSIDGYSIYAGLEACRDFLQSFGGHEYAAGLAIESDRIVPFREALKQHANDRITIDHLTPAMRIDCDAALDELTVETVERLARLSPFGRGNPKPRLLLRNLRINGAPRQMGANGRHLDFLVKSNGRTSRAVWWNAASMAPQMASGSDVDLVVDPKLNHWNGRTTVEIEVLDARLAAP